MPSAVIVAALARRFNRFVSLLAGVTDEIDRHRGAMSTRPMFAVPPVLKADRKAVAKRALGNRKIAEYQKARRKLFAICSRRSGPHE
jgi:hypothetical protein